MVVIVMVVGNKQGNLGRGGGAEKVGSVFVRVVQVRVRVRLGFIHHNYPITAATATPVRWGLRAGQVPCVYGNLKLKL